MRSAELVTHALDDARLDALRKAFEAAGLTVMVGTLHEQDYLLGWTITAR